METLCILSKSNLSTRDLKLLQSVSAVCDLAMSNLSMSDFKQTKSTLVANDSHFVFTPDFVQLLRRSNSKFLHFHQN